MQRIREVNITYRNHIRPHLIKASNRLGCLIPPQPGMPQNLPPLSLFLSKLIMLLNHLLREETLPRLLI